MHVVNEECGANALREVRCFRWRRLVLALRSWPTWSVLLLISWRWSV